MRLSLRCRGRWIAILTLMVQASATSRACAQGTRGELPDPITANSLNAYAGMLNLSAQQRHALEDLHATYREEFQRLRQGEIQAFIQTESRFYTRAYIHKQRDLSERIAAIDNRLFDAVLLILVDEQAARLQRVRMLRQRERIMQIKRLWLWREAPPFDLSQALTGIDLPAEHMQAIDQALLTYEPALTVRFQRVLDVNFEAFEKAFDAYDRAGWTEKKLADPANYEACSAVTKPIWNAHQIQSHRNLTEIVALNRKTLEALTPSLPAPAAHSLRSLFIRTTYPQIAALTYVQSPWDDALARTDLTDDQRQSLEPQAAQFWVDADSMTNEMVARVERYRDTWAGTEFDREQEFKDRMALEREVDLAWQSLRERAKADAARITSIVGGRVAADADVPDPESADLAQNNATLILFGRPDVSAWLPHAISAQDVVQYAQWLGLDTAATAQLNTVHQRYQQQFAAFRSKYHDAMWAARAALNAGDTIEGYTDDNLNHYRAIEATVASEQKALDDVFFADLQQTLQLKLDEASLDRVRLARQRQWFACRYFDSRTRQPGGRGDGLFDLAFMVRQVRSLDLSDPAADRIMAEYEKAIAPLLKARLDAMVQFETVDEELRVEWQKRRVETGETYPDMTDRNRERGVRALQAAAVKAAEPIAALNRATVDRLRAALPAESAERVRRTFERMAWPNIYGDRSCAAGLLQAAINVSDLTLQQRTDIENLAAEYRPAYDEMCEKMKTMVEGPDSSIYATERAPDEDWIAFNKRRNARQRLLFERHELSVRVWQRLKTILAEEQAKTIGMKASPPDGPAENDDFGT